jgi:transposase
LTKQIDDIDDSIIELINSDTEIKQLYKIISSCKGIGITTAATIMAQMPEIGKVSNNQISALAGLAPFNCDSGTFKGKRRIRGGRSEIRKAL